jgi:hypothetical protein
LHAQPAGESINLDLETIKGALLVSGSGQCSFGKPGEFHYRAQSSPDYTVQLAPLMDILGKQEVDGSVTFAFPLPPLK